VKNKYIIILLIFIITIFVGHSNAKQPKSKFYDFNEQLIDGQIKKPTNLYVDSRAKVRFDRLLKLKKSFLPALFKTAKERIFK
jgi:hypothetical protein